MTMKMKFRFRVDITDSGSICMTVGIHFISGGTNELPVRGVGIFPLCTDNWIVLSKSFQLNVHAIDFFFFIVFFIF